MTTNSLESEARELAARYLAEGFDTHEEIETAIIEMLSEEHDEAAVTSAARAAIADAAAAREREMQSWPAVTDCDRLDAAFEELNNKGIMARHDWTCCGNCGQAEMPAEFERLDGQWNGTPLIGYVFYHQQDTESATDGSGLYFGYGTTDPAESKDAYDLQLIAVARTVCNTLAKHGLQTQWDGTVSKRIRLDLNWQRRARPRRFCGDRPDLD